MAVSPPKSSIQIYADGSASDNFWHGGGKKCFYCHQILDEEAYAVQWMGAADEDLLLHPGCVIELTLRLYRDVHEIECRSAESEPLRGWAPRAKT